MTNLWRWSRKEIQASPDRIQALWGDGHAPTLQKITQRLDEAWRKNPYLITSSDKRTTVIDKAVASISRQAVYDFTRSPQGKILEMIGHWCLEWEEFTWNDRLNDICRRIVDRSDITFTSDEGWVLRELHQRVTTIRTKGEIRNRTPSEIRDIVAFWWNLQQYRSRYLRRKGRAYAVDENLTTRDCEKVRRDWEDTEVWPTLRPKQHADIKEGNQSLASIYNAALYKKSGWCIVANSIIKYRLPELPPMQAGDDLIKHIENIESFCDRLLVWLQKFAADALAKWHSEEYKKAERNRQAQRR